MGSLPTQPWPDTKEVEEEEEEEGKDEGHLIVREEQSQLQALQLKGH